MGQAYQQHLCGQVSYDPCYRFHKILTNTMPSYVDRYISLIAGSGAFAGNRSIVVHLANKTRIACANFVPYTNATTSVNTTSSANASSSSTRSSSASGTSHASSSSTSGSGSGSTGTGSGSSASGSGSSASSSSSAPASTGAASQAWADSGLVMLFGGLALFAM